MKWHATDLIDFEYLLRGKADEKTDNTDRDADREIYQAYVAKHPEPVCRRDLFRFWLQKKREALSRSGGTARVLPGTAASEMLNWLTWLAGIAGLLVGGGLCGSLLAYAGQTPVNVFTCLWVMLGPQLFLLILLGVAAIFRSLGHPPPVSGFYPLLAGLLKKLVNRLLRSGVADIPAQKRHAMSAALGMMGQARSIYGQILFRPVFIIGQVFGICFNAGMAAVLMSRVMITDLAFGWQSTLQPAAETVHQIVSFIALPWSWALPAAFAQPSVAQIEGSQFVYKEGMRHLASPDLMAWWPFLFMALIVYGLLPRLVILGAALWRQSRSLKRLSFNHSACQQLLQTMRTPRVQTYGRGFTRPAAASPDLSSEGYPDAKAPGSDSRGAAQTPEGPLEEALVLVPEDIDPSCSSERINENLRNRLGLAMASRIACRMDPDADMAAIKKILAENKTSPPHLVMIQEAWQPPIQEILGYITAISRQLHQQGGKRGELVVGLIGKPRADSVFTPPADSNRRVWEQAIAKLGDPWIRVETLGGAH